MNTPDDEHEHDPTLVPYALRLAEIYNGHQIPSNVSWQDLSALFAQDELPTSMSLTGRLRQNQLLKRRYRILEKIGRGGFAAVYKAEDLQYRSRLVALKEMSQNGLGPEELAEDTEAFQREAQMLASLQHPHLPRIYDHFSEQGRWYFVMDFIEGETLEDYLLRQPEHRLSLKATLEIGLQLCLVLDYLHTRRPPIIFRDLKPANIMRTASGHLYLIDFGIARHFKPGQIKDTVPFGSPGYAAPEQYGKAQTTQRSDIYSLGVLLHHLLSGLDPAEKPFLLPPLQSSEPEELEELQGLITHMTHLDAEQRPGSIAEVQAEFQRLASPDPQKRRNLAPLKRAHNGTGARAMQKQISLPSAGQKQIVLPPARRFRRRLIVDGMLAGAALAAGSLSIYTLLFRQTIISSSETFQPASLQAVPVPQRLLVYRGHAAPVTSVSWSPQGSVIASTSFASASNNGSTGTSTVQVWRADNGRRLSLTDIANVEGIDWSPDGKFLAVASAANGSVRAWNPLTGQHVFTYPVDPAGNYAVAYSPDGTLIGVGTSSGAQVLNVADGRVIFQDVISKTSQVGNVAWTGDSSVFAWVCLLAQETLGGQVNPVEMQFWERKMGTLLTYSQKSLVSAVGGSRDGTLLAIGWQGGQITLWNITQRRTVRTYIQQAGTILDVRWSPDGKYIASASADSTVCVWNPQTGDTLTIYQGHRAAVNSLSWSPDSTRIASGSDDNSVQIWKALP